MLYTNGFGISLLADAALKLNSAEKTDYKKEFKIYKKRVRFPSDVKFLPRKCCMLRTLLSMADGLAILPTAELCCVRNVKACLEHLQLILF